MSLTDLPTYFCTVFPSIYPSPSTAGLIQDVDGCPADRTCWIWPHASLPPLAWLVRWGFHSRFSCTRKIFFEQLYVGLQRSLKMEWGLNALQVVVDERLKDQEISLPAMTLNFYAGSSGKVAISENIFFWGGCCVLAMQTRKSEMWTGFLTFFVLSWIAFT